MMWAVFALGAAALTSFNPILYKRMLKDADSLVVVWGVTLLGVPLLGFLTFALNLQLPRLDWLFAIGVIGSVGLNAIAHIASTRSLKLADVSLVTPLLILSPVFTVLIAALFLEEIPSARGFLGVVFVLIGAYWLNLDSSAGWLTPFKSFAISPAIALVLLARLLWAITPLFEKTAVLHTDPGSPRFTAFVINALLAVILTPLVLARGKTAISNLLLNRCELFLAGLIAGIAPVLGYTAFSLGLVGYVTTLFKLSTLFTLIWSFLLLKETNIAQRFLASLVMVLGAILIAT